ncbi:MAG: nucleoside hydrolase [Hyphomonadaceae bacterium]|nr:nucleoside hydrolase [Hyphomonadaceae bacterium]
MTKTPIIIDCDPGQDDAVMLMMAFAKRDQLDILGICTVAGNVSIDKTTRNARIICEICGQTDIPVYAGYAAPLKRRLFTADEVHGEEGMNGVKVYEPEMPVQEKHAVNFIVDILREKEDGEVTLIVTGPMTNIAAAFSQAPGIKKKVKEIILMGGALRMGGNVTPSAEFNIFVDPEAAHIVYKSGVKTVTIGLDVTHQVLASNARLARIKAIGNKVADTACEILGPYSFFDSEKYGTDGGPLHDPCTIAYLLDPSLFKTKFCNIEVECNSELTVGHTAVDFWEGMDPKERPKNTHWAYEVDDKGVYRLLEECLATFS